MNVTGKLLIAFVTLLVGAVLITSIASESQDRTTTINVVNEAHDITASADTNGSTMRVNTTATYTVTNNPTGWKTTDCPLTSFSLKNGSGTAYTLTTDYTITAATGVYKMVQSATTNGSTAADNKTYASYTYCGDDYLNSSWGRTVLNLVSGFFAIAMLLISVGLFYSVGKDAGIV